MKNNLSDLNNHLFAQIERLGKENISTDELAHEVVRTKAISTIATDIVNTSKVCLDALKTKLEYQAENQELPVMLQNKESK